MDAHVDWRYRGLLAIVGLVGVALVLVGGLHVAVGPAIAFLLAACFLEAAPASPYPETRVSLAVVAEFVALAYGGWPLMVVTAAGTGLLAGSLGRGRKFEKALYNLGMLTTSATVAAVVYSLVLATDFLAPAQTMAVQQPLRLSVALLLAAFAYTMTNIALLSAVVHFSAAVPFGTTFRSALVQGTILQFVYVGLAAISYVLLVQVGPVSLLLMTVPLLVARRSLQSVEKRQKAFDRMVGAFVETIQAKDGYTRGHAERVSELSVRVAERMGLSYEDRELIRYGAILHDVGKVGVSLGILCKAGPLTDDEFDEMKRHPDIGADILEDIDFLQPALAIVRHHHERIDGRGYPASLASGEIPLLTRVVTAVDAFDAMTSTRSYRRALPVEVAIGELQNNAGTQFDAEVVGHLVAVIEQDGWTVTDEPVTVSSPITAARS